MIMDAQSQHAAAATLAAMPIVSKPHRRSANHHFRPTQQSNQYSTTPYSHQSSVMISDFSAAEFFNYTATPSHQHYSTQFNTVSMGKLKLIQQQQQQQQIKSTNKNAFSSPLNALFTWKRKSNKQPTPAKNGAAASLIVSGALSTTPKQQHPCCSTSNSVPSSLARLFPQQSAAKNDPTETNMNIVSSLSCVCRGLTGSTFMVPTYFDDDNRELIAHSSAKNKLSSSNDSKSKSGTVRSVSNNSLFDYNNHNKQSKLSSNSIHHRSAIKPFQTINERKLNGTKSMERIPVAKPVPPPTPPSTYLSASTPSIKSIVKNNQSNSTNQESSSQTTSAAGTSNRRSILECNVNPYELVMDDNHQNVNDSEQLVDSDNEVSDGLCFFIDNFFKINS